MAPGESMPRKFIAWQMWELPRWQAAHRPQGRVGITVTAGRRSSRSTPSPTAAIRPDISCPMIARVTDPGVHVAVVDVQVRAADAGVRHLDPHLAGTGWLRVAVLDSEVRAPR